MLISIQLSVIDYNTDTIDYCLIIKIINLCLIIRCSTVIFIILYIMKNLLHQIFINWRSQTFLLHDLLVFLEFIPYGDYAISFASKLYVKL